MVAGRSVMAIEKNWAKQNTKPVILIVDDQPQNIELLEAYLVPQGYEIVKAVNGAEALETLSANKIDLILLDVTMPGMDGFEVTRRVRSDDKNRLLPIIIVTALREREDRVKGIEAGCDDFLSKPVDKIELLARVQSLLKIKAYNDLASNYRKELEVTQKSTEEALEYADSIINTVREPLIALDQDLRVITASRSFYETFKVKPEETVGQLIYDLGNNQWDIPKLRELLETILPQKTTFDNYEVEHDFVTIGKRIMLLNARQIHTILGKERIILLAIEDITERKKTEEILQRLEREYHSFMEKALSEQRDLTINLKNTMVSRDDLIKEATKREQTEHLLMVRMRQLQAFYSLAEIIEREGILLNEFYQELANILPNSWQYPEITCARIVIGESEFRMKNFIETEWMQSATVKVNGLQVGRIDVGYLEQKPKQDEGPFLREERMLLDAITERLGRVIERKQLEEALKGSEIRYRRLFEAARDGILTLDVDTGTVMDVNPFMVEMLGFSREEFLGKKIWELGSFKDVIANRNNFEELQRKRYLTYENLPLETASGQRIEVEFVSNVYDVGNQKVIQCNIRDITVRKRLEIEKEKIW
jgi:PAS domain S-box-containing protein